MLIPVPRPRRQVPVVMMSVVVGPTSGVWSTVLVLSGNLISVTLTYNPGDCILYPETASFFFTLNKLSISLYELHNS